LLKNDHLLRFILRRCGVQPSTPHSSGFRGLASALFEQPGIDDFFNRLLDCHCEQSEAISGDCFVTVNAGFLAITTFFSSTLFINCSTLCSQLDALCSIYGLNFF
jgi:hypothetical protein